MLLPIYQGVVTLLTPLYLSYVCFNYVAGKYSSTFVYERFGWYPKQEANKKVIMLVAEGLGEYSALKTLLAKLHTSQPEYTLTLCVTTEVVYKLAKANPHIQSLHYLAFDQVNCVQSMLIKLNPQLLVIIERAVYPNLLISAKKYNIPCLSISARLSEKSATRQQYVAKLYKTLYHLFTRIGVQDEESRKNIRRFEVDESRLMITGNLKYAQEYLNQKDYKKKRDERRKLLGPDEKLIIMAYCSYEEEEHTLLKVLRKLNDGKLRGKIILILAPRRVERSKKIQYTFTNAGFQVSSLQERLLQASDDVYIINQYGKLPKFLHWSDIVYVGGSNSNIGGHNPLEALYAYNYVLSGPSNGNFTSVWREIVKSNLGTVVNNTNEICDAITNRMGIKASTDEHGDFFKKGEQSLHDTHALITTYLP